MTRRKVTITIDTQLDRKIRIFQEQITKVAKKKWSYSEIAGILLEQGLNEFNFEYTKSRLRKNDFDG